MQVCPQPKIKKTQAEWTARGCVVPKRPMKNSRENEKTKIEQKICPVKPAQEHLKCNSQERQNKLEQNSNHQSVSQSLVSIQFILFISVLGILTLLRDI